MIYDIFVIGGGINGVAIARDAAGRGLNVALAEKGDLAEETSSKSTKLYHGGLRYLEYFEFKLVRDALREREILLKNMPHIAWPMRFVLPISHDMRFDGETPTSKLLRRLMPWLKGRRPQWLIRTGLFIYDTIGGRKLLPPTTKLNLKAAPEGEALQDRFTIAFEYSDVWAQDARVVSLMARDASERGAKIMTRNKVLRAKREDQLWHIETEHGHFQARQLVNASGPWVETVTRSIINVQPQAGVRLVKGSHIVVPKLYTHDKTYFFQGTDGRIIFAIPYENDYTLIGTTDQGHDVPDNPPICSDNEKEYLCNFANLYFKSQISPADIIWSYAGVRPLYDDGAKSATAATREYVLKLHSDAAPLLNVFGGKITTHRHLAEEALEMLGYGDKWTKTAPLPGGEFDVEAREDLIDELQNIYPKLDARRVFSTYGLEAFQIFKGDWGADFGAGLYACEVDHLMRHEFAQTAEDILWRRTKLGLKLKEVRKLETYMRGKTT